MGRGNRRTVAGVGTATVAMVIVIAGIALGAASWRSHHTDTDRAAALRTQPAAAPSDGPAWLESPIPESTTASTDPLTTATPAAATPTTVAAHRPATTDKPAPPAYLDLTSPNWVGAWGVP